jgi:hypothetical protein
MATYPAGIVSWTNVADTVDTVLAAHPNNAYAEIIAVETALGINPYTISDAVAPGSTPSSVGNYLDMVATQLKAITGQANWYTAPGNTIVLLTANKVSIPAGSVIGDMLYHNGTTYARRAIGSTGQVLQVSGGLPAWATLSITALGGIPAPASPVTGDILYYTGAAWARLPVGAANQALIVSGGIPSWAGSVPSSLADGQWTAWNAGKVDLRLRSPAVVASGGVIAEYGTIQGAITAAASGQTVVIPPGTYTENLTLKTGVNVLELVPGSVTLAGSIDTGTVAMACTVSIDTLTTGSAFAGTLYGVLLRHTSGTVNLIIRTISINTTTILDVACLSMQGAGIAVVRCDSIGASATVTASIVYGITCTVGSGTLTVTCRSVSLSAASALAVAGASASAGFTGVFTVYGATITAPNGTNGVASSSDSACTINLYGCKLSAKTYGASVSLGTFAAYNCIFLGTTLDLSRTGGALSVFACQYDPAKTDGVTYLRGDRMRPAQSSLFAQCFG